MEAHLPAESTDNGLKAVLFSGAICTFLWLTLEVDPSGSGLFLSIIVIISRLLFAPGALVASLVLQSSSDPYFEQISLACCFLLYAGIAWVKLYFDKPRTTEQPR